LCRTQVPSDVGFLIHDEAVRKGVTTFQCDIPGTCGCLRTKSCKTTNNKKLLGCGKPLRCSDRTGAKRCMSFVACDSAALQRRATVRFRCPNLAARRCTAISGLLLSDMHAIQLQEPNGKEQAAVAVILYPHLLSLPAGCSHSC